MCWHVQRQIIFLKMSLLLLSLYCSAAFAGLGDPSYVSDIYLPNSLPLVSERKLATLYVENTDEKGVQRALGDLQQDVQRVTNQSIKIVHQRDKLGEFAVIVGTIGKSQLIDELIAQGKFDPKDIVGKWDAFHLELVSNPLPNVKQALIIAGANKRGTTYGIYDLSETIGVSPWYYWADVPVAHKKNLYVLDGTKIQDAPKVKYRGIFLNDEAPALTNWVKENHGDFNHEFYVKVFELLLRLKANFMWPAMWNNAFADDDPLNMILADEYGIVMSTSHHEPMMRADKEWNRYGEGRWEYSTNPENLRKFWQAGAERNKPYESVFTMGMRGQEDTPMSEGQNIELLETIVRDQREIIKQVFTDRPVEDVPQVWCLYKEVQDYYDNGMRVPDDVILLWSDDNWGNIRRLPTPGERKRKGGAGVYYHFDYVGGPRSYRWINTVPLAKIWEQMNLAYSYQADQIWITNVGDLKPMEYPIEYFLRMAWDPERWPKERIKEFGQLWAAREFGIEYAQEIETLMTGYTRHGGRRKAELLEPDTYSLLHYDEAERIEMELKSLVTRAEALYKMIPANKKDAFFQLVYHPVKATATVTLMNIALGRNRLYAMQGRADANEFADLAKRYFAEDQKLKQQYHQINGGKWNHFMDQTHIGYTNWNHPEGDQMPATFDYSPGNYGEMGIAVEGYVYGWPAVSKLALAFDQSGTKQRWFTIYNRGTQPFEFKATAKQPWIKLSQANGSIAVAETIEVSLDWATMPEGESLGAIDIRGTGWQGASIKIKAFKPTQQWLDNAVGFVEADGFVAIEAANYVNTKTVDGISWQKIEQHGRTDSSISTFPTGDKSFKNPKKAPYVEYDVTFSSTGTFQVQTILAPTWPIVPGRGLRYAIGIDKEKPKVIDFLAGMEGTDEAWEDSVRNGVRIGVSEHKVTRVGPSKVRLYMVDPAVTVQKIIIDTGGLKPSYLGPPQSPQK